MDGDDLFPVACPYCGEQTEITVDSSGGTQEFIEDCSVCCRPIAFTLRVGADGVTDVDAGRDDE
jgi:hypothetical protein